MFVDSSDYGISSFDVLMTSSGQQHVAYVQSTERGGQVCVASRGRPDTGFRPFVVDTIIQPGQLMDFEPLRVGLTLDQQGGLEVLTMGLPSVGPSLAMFQSRQAVGLADAPREDLNVKRLSVGPLPAHPNGVILLRSAERTDVVSVQLIDLSGREVMRREFDGTGGVRDLHLVRGIVPGMYFVNAGFRNGSRAGAKILVTLGP